MTRWAVRRAIAKAEGKWEDGGNPVRDRINAGPRAAWPVLRVTHLLFLIVGFGVAAPALAQVSDQPAVNAYTLTPERTAASVAAVAGLIGAVIGGLALARSAGRIGNGRGRRGAIMALVLGPIGVIIGGLVVVTADGGLGTGNGLGGGIVAIALGLMGMALGGLALARSRRLA